MNIQEQTTPLSPIKRALIKIEELEAKLKQYEAMQHEPIAIVGMGCRFPGDANTPAAYWELLRTGVSTVGEAPWQRWQDNRRNHATVKGGKNKTTYYGHYLREVGCFDAPFFGISPREAIQMDPQQQLLLEVSIEALEHANLPVDELLGSRTGVYIGAMNQDYLQSLHQLDTLDVYAATGSEISFTAGRLSYLLGLRGPAMMVGTACSSSLVTTHLACQSLRARECDLALSGGVSLILAPTSNILLTKMQATSPDGRCKTFDAAADGYGRGEGCGILVLKRLADAQRDGDTIWALIRGSAVNHDGRSGGLTVPSGPAQEELLRQAVADARVAPHEISYIEAHGTGTALGDPIEMRALGNVLCKNRPTPLIIGSAKTNIGHLEAAAGVAGLMKVILALQNKQIPPHLHFRQPNPHIPWAQYSIQVQTNLTAWSSDKPRLAGVSSFGLSGINAHAILAEAPAVVEPLAVATRPYHLLTLSAKTPQALHALAQCYRDSCATQPPLELGDLCYTAHVGRSHYPHRLSLVAASSEDVRTKLAAYVAQEILAGVTENQANEQSPKVAFLFTGQGSQYVGMGRELYETDPTFRATLDRCDELLRPHLSESLLATLYPDKETGRSVSIDLTEYTQPALFALEYALATLWQSWGIQPDILLGHSVGEVVAACVAGVFSLEDGIKLIAARGRLMGALPQDGAMLAVQASAAHVQQAIAPYHQEVSLAAINGPASVVLSGQREAVQMMAAQLTAAGIKTHHLTVSHAFHSPLMAPMLADFRQVAASITYHKPKVPLVSNVTGNLAGDGSTARLSSPKSEPAEVNIATPDYWVRQVREPVRFADGLQTLQAQGISIFLEIGPKPVLLGMAEQVTGDKGQVLKETNTRAHLPPTPCHLPSLRENHADWQQMLTSLGELYVRGVKVDWLGFDKDYARRKVVLPTYPFQRQRYWVEPTLDEQPLTARQAHVTPLIDKLIPLPRRQEIVGETHFSLERLPFLADHKVFGAVISPGACQLAMVLEAAHLAYPGRVVQLVDVVLPQALVLGADESRTVQVIFSPAEQSNGQEAPAFELISFSAAQPTESLQTHASGRLAFAAMAPSAPVDLAALQAHCSTGVDLATFDAQVAAQQIDFGPAFRWLAAVWRGENEAIGRLVLPEAIGNLQEYQLHPALLDACLQLIGALQLGEAQTETRLPFALGSLTLAAPVTGQAWWGHVRQSSDQSWQIQLLDGDGSLIVCVEGFIERAAPRHLLLGREAWRDWLYHVQWQAQPLAMTATPLATAETWLLFADPAGIGGVLADQLEAQGKQCVLVWRGDRYTMTESLVRPHKASSERTIAKKSRKIATLRPSSRADYATLFADLSASTLPCQAVIYLWGIESGSCSGINSSALNADGNPVVNADVPTAVLELCGGFLHLVQALSQATWQPRLWLVTQDSQAVGHRGRQVQVEQAPLWGLARTVMAEHPEFACSCIDVDTLTPQDLAQCLLTEFFFNAKEPQIVYRDGQRSVARLNAYPLAEPLEQTAQPFQARLADYGSPDYLQFLPISRRQPTATEIEIQVQAAGLNLRDVLNILGMLQSHYAAEYNIHAAADLPLGFECAGIVVAVGEAITNFAVGDRVMALTEGSFASFVTVHQRHVARIPAGMTFNEAATLPVAFLTAYQGLMQLAQLRRGDRLLIHAAAGGVGQAAVQIAQVVGAEIYATASPGKWNFLRSQGIRHLYNSRTLDFSAAILHDTDGQGVDVVLNSLNGDFIAHSVKTLAPKGRFVEIGKLDIWPLAQMQAHRPDVAYYPFEVANDAVDNTAPALFDAVMNLLTLGKVRPLPHVTFPIREIATAVRYMQQAKQQGKIVLSFAPPAPITIQADRSYLITGGLGGLGLQVAQALAEAGARHLLLASRNEMISPEAQQILDPLRQKGVNVVVVKANVAEATAVERLLAISNELAPLRGIIHAAGVLEDGILLQQNLERFAKVMAAKVAGTWHLHQLSQPIPLDFFVCFSSMAAMVETAGQGNYAAANVFLDALMAQRQAMGLPALSLQWGAWAKVGMAANLSYQQQGITAIDPAEGSRLLVKLIQQTNHQRPASIAVQPIHWPSFLAHITAPSPFYERFVAQTRVAEVTELTVNLRQQLQTLPVAERTAHLMQYLQKLTAKILGFTANERINPAQGLIELGLDSLMSIELKNRIMRDLGISIPMADLIDISIEKLTNLLAAEWTLRTLAHTPTTAPLATSAGPAAGEAIMEEMTI